MRCRQASLVIFEAVFFGLLIALLSPAQAQPQPAETGTEGPSLQGFYDSALRFQNAGDLDQAAGQYREFLAAALDELANGRSWAGDSAKASSLFEEALLLAPASPSLELDYARAALRAGDLEHAEKLARGLLHQDGIDARNQAQAHETLGLTLHKMSRDQEARKELEAAVALDPSLTNQYDLAVVCLGIDEEKCAVQAFDWIEASAADTPALHMRIGLAYGDSDFAPRAVAEFKKAIAEDPRYPNAHYCVAAALLAVGEDEKTLVEAESELKQELAISPNNFLAYAALGKIAVSYHRYAEAESYLKRAIALNAKNPDAFLYLGQMDYETNRLSDAETNLRKSIQLTSDVSRNHFQIQKAHFLLGRILMQQHRETEAHAEMQIAHSFNDKALSADKNKLSAMLPGNGAGTGGPDAPAGLAPATVGQPGDPEAIRKLKALEDVLTPPIADSYNNLGVIAASKEKYPEAFKYFSRARAWRPSLDGLDLNLGRAAFMSANFPEAIPPLTRYLRAHPQETGMRGPLAMSQFMTHNYGACLETLKGAGESVTSIPQMQYFYAESLVKTGQVATGLARLQSLEKADPNVTEVHRGIGEVYEIRRDWLHAMAELNQAIRLKADDAESHYDLGNADLATGNTAAAIGELEGAVRLNPADARFHQALAVAYDRDFRPADAEKERQAAAQLLKTQAPAEKTTPAATKPPS
jgi:tetratricopeptide (TPR) repeat protein